MGTINEARRMFAERKQNDSPSKKLEAVEPLGDSDDSTVHLAIAAKKKYAIVAGGADAVLLFGKYKMRRIAELASDVEGRDYLKWMLGQDFSKNLLKVVRQCLART